MVMLEDAQADCCLVAQCYYWSMAHNEYSKDQKKNIICTMDDVRGDFLGPPHGTTPAAVIANKNNC